MYQSLLTRQRSLRKESSRIIIDTSGPLKYNGLTPLELMAYIIKVSLWIQGRVYAVNDEIGCVSAEDPLWDRDQHIILVKKKNEYNEQQMIHIIKILTEYIKQRKILLLLNAMIQRLKYTKDKQGRELLTQLERYKKNIQNSYDREIIFKVIKMWMSDNLLGPFAVTRTLYNYHYESVQHYIADPLVIEIRKGLGEHFCDYEIDQITIIDDRMFILPYDDVKAMDWPYDVEFDIVAIAGNDRLITKHQNSRIMAIYKTNYIKCAEQSDDTKYELVVEHVVGMDRFIMTLKYGKYVFDGVDKGMLKILQRQEFINWCRNTAKLTLWFGRDEKDKIHDYESFRMNNYILKQRIRALEIENEKLKNVTKVDS